MRPENNRWLRWKRITQSIYVFSMEGKTAAGAFGRARNYGWDCPFDLGNSWKFWNSQTDADSYKNVLIYRKRSKYCKDCIICLYEYLISKQQPRLIHIYTVHIREATTAQIEVFLEMWTSVSTAVRTWPKSTLFKNSGGQSEVPHPSSVFLNHFSFRVDFGHLRTAAETDVRGKQF